MANSLTAGIPQETLGDRKWKVLLYGLSGAGKTRTASIFPKPLFFDFDHGLGSIDRKIAWVTMTEWADWTMWLDILLTKPIKADTIVIDSVNAMQRMAMEYSVKTFGAKRAHGDIPGMSDYGKMFWDVWRGFQQLAELPYHLVLIAQCDPGSFGELHKPSLEGKAMVEPLTQLMDLIGYVEKTGPREVSLSFDRSDATTKDRFGLFLGTTLTNPTWKEMEVRIQKKTPKREAPQIQEGKPKEAD